jgi:hypothetical protein
MKVVIELLCIGGKRGSPPRYISFRDEMKVVRITMFPIGILEI